MDEEIYTAAGTGSPDGEPLTKARMLEVFEHFRQIDQERREMIKEQLGKLCTIDLDRPFAPMAPLMKMKKRPEYPTMEFLWRERWP